MAQPARAPDHEHGMSLVEVMIAMVVSIVLLGAIHTTVASHGRQRQAMAERSLAVTALINTLERARTLTNAEIEALDGVGFDVPGLNGTPGGLQPVRGDADGLPGQLTVARDKVHGGAVLYRVTGTVRWFGAGGDRVILLQTLVGERR